MKFPEIWNFQLKWWYKPWRIEKDFRIELQSKLEKLKWFIVFHPADIWLSNKFLDLHLITLEWIWYWLELKKIPCDTFNVKNFEDEQVILLREMEKRNPELARVWIYSIKHNDYKILRFSEIWNNQNEKWGVKIFSNN